MIPARPIVRIYRDSVDHECGDREGGNLQIKKSGYAGGQCLLERDRVMARSVSKIL